MTTARAKIRWKDGLCIIGNTIVGVIQTNGVRRWSAFGCMTEWEDTPIDSGITTEAQAKRAVEAWVKENSI